LKAETGSEIIATQYPALQTNIMQQTYYKQKQIANAEYAKNLKTQ
jgi:hypothetical protein